MLQSYTFQGIGGSWGSEAGSYQAKSRSWIQQNSFEGNSPKKKNQLSLDTKVLHFTRFSRPAQSRVKMVRSSPQLSNRTTNLPEVLKTQWTGQWVLSRQGPHLTRWQVGWGTWLVSEKETNILMLSFSSWTKCLLTLTHPAMRCANKCF